MQLLFEVTKLRQVQAFAGDDNTMKIESRMIFFMLGLLLWPDHVGFGHGGINPCAQAQGEGLWLNASTAT